MPRKAEWTEELPSALEELRRFPAAGIDRAILEKVLRIGRRTAIMLALVVPAFSLRLGNTAAANDPASQTTHKAYDLLAQGFGQGFSGPLLVAIKLPAPGRTAGLALFSSALRNTPGVAAVSQPRLSPTREAATISAFPTSSPQSTQTENLVEHLRRAVIPPTPQRWSP